MSAAEVRETFGERVAREWYPAATTTVMHEKRVALAAVIDRLRAEEVKMEEARPTAEETEIARLRSELEAERRRREEAEAQLEAATGPEARSAILARVALERDRANALLREIRNGGYLGNQEETTAGEAHDRMLARIDAHLAGGKD